MILKKISKTFGWSKKGVPKTILVLKMWAKKFVGSKNLGSNRITGPKKIWYRKFLFTIIFGSKTYKNLLKKNSPQNF